MMILLSVFSPFPFTIGTSKYINRCLQYSIEQYTVHPELYTHIIKS